MRSCRKIQSADSENPKFYLCEEVSGFPVDAELPAFSMMISTLRFC